MAASTPAAARQRRPPRIPAAERRAQIISVAHDVFGSRGFHHSSLGQVADQIGITHQAVLHHFGSKEQLLVEVIRYRERLDVEALESGELPQGVDLLRHLVRTAAVNTGRKALVRSYAVLSAESVTEGNPAQASFRERFNVLRDLIAVALRTCCGTQLAVPEEADRAASIIIAVMDGLQVQWLLDPDAVDMPESVELVIDALLHRWGVARLDSGGPST